jgi:hypothetical protein
LPGTQSDQFRPFPNLLPEPAFSRIILNVEPARQTCGPEQRMLRVLRLETPPMKMAEAEWPEGALWAVGKRLLAAIL